MIDSEPRRDDGAAPTLGKARIPFANICLQTDGKVTCLTIGDGEEPPRPDQTFRIRGVAQRSWALAADEALRKIEEMRADLAVAAEQVAEIQDNRLPKVLAQRPH